MRGGNIIKKRMTLSEYIMWKKSIVCEFIDKLSIQFWTQFRHSFAFMKFVTCFEIDREKRDWNRKWVKFSTWQPTNKFINSNFYMMMTNWLICNLENLKLNKQIKLDTWKILSSKKFSNVNSTLIKQIVSYRLKTVYLDFIIHNHCVVCLSSDCKHKKNKQKISFF